MNSNPFLATKATKPQAVPLADATHVILGGVQYRIIGRPADYVVLRGPSEIIERTPAELDQAGAILHNFRRPGA